MNHEGHEGSRRKTGLPNFLGRFAQYFVLRLLRAYKWAVSPLFLPACRYVPTCSEYAMEAVERYGGFRGGLMAVLRLLRCNPFARGGYDPVVKANAGSERAGFAQGLKPECFLIQDGAAGSRALSKRA
ncbi:MAG TPA: membrane protein insertion efficiency factor YidD [Candidatus Sulfotelmatobacter sp.]|nr:membrane protein insertion efficiency factor YidD [Candidatus Sulfotelmatobacter sp.]